MDRRRRLFAGSLAVSGVLFVLGISPLWYPAPLTHRGRTVTEWSLDLLSPAAPMRSNATQVLQNFGEAAVPSLRRQLRPRDSWLRIPFIKASGHLPTGLRRAILRYLQPYRPRDERAAAVAALSLLGTNAPLDLLFGILRDPERRFANQASLALGRYGPGAVPGLSLALRDPDLEVRCLACSALSQIGPAAAPAVARVAALLSDSPPQIMAVAAHTLATIGPPSVPYLTQLLEHPEPHVRDKAVIALGQLRYGARDSLPVLERLLEDEDPLVRDHVRAALHAVAPLEFDEFGTRHPSASFEHSER